MSLIITFSIHLNSYHDFKKNIQEKHLCVKKLYKGDFDKIWIKYLYIFD